MSASARYRLARSHVCVPAQAQLLSYRAGVASVISTSAPVCVCAALERWLSGAETTQSSSSDDA